MTRSHSLRSTACGALLAMAASAAAVAAQAGKAQTVNNLQVAVTSLERTEKAALEGFLQSSLP